MPLFFTQLKSITPEQDYYKLEFTGGAATYFNPFFITLNASLGFQKDKYHQPIFGLTFNASRNHLIVGSLIGYRFNLPYKRWIPYLGISINFPHTEPERGNWFSIHANSGIRYLITENIAFGAHLKSHRILPNKDNDFIKIEKGFSYYF